MNIKDIARISGYSVGTVSRVLNSSSNVSQKAHDQIMDVVEKYQFEPNANARSLKRIETHSIAVMVKGRYNPLFANILEKLHTYLDMHGENVYVAYLDEDENEVQFALRYQTAHNPRGIVFLGGELEYFKRDFSRIVCPCVLITNSTQSLPFDNLSCVLTNDGQASADIVDVLIKAHHTKIAVIGGNLSQGQISLRRLSGAIRRCAQSQIPFDMSLQYEPCHFSMQEGYDALMRLLRRVPDTTAIYALGDVIAIGVMRALRDIGKSVPEDISLVGFDGIESAQFCIPRLTTVRQDTTRLAERGASILLSMIEGTSRGNLCEIVAHTVLKGETVKDLSESHN